MLEPHTSCKTILIQIIGITYDEDDFPVISQEAKDHQSVWENAGYEIPDPEDDGDTHSCVAEDMAVDLMDNWIYRTHRSHKPYGKGVD